MKSVIKKSLGFTLVELLVALVIISGVVTLANSLVDDYMGQKRLAIAGQQMATVGKAGKSYIKDNYAAISTVATAVTPALIRISTLVSSSYLASGSATTNSYGQAMCVLVLQPTVGKLIGLVVAEGGTTLADVNLGPVAAAIGAEGGGIYSTTSTSITGSVGGWSLPIANFANANQLGMHCNGTAGAVAIAVGHPAVALWFSDGDPTGGALYRNLIPGQPQLNQMNTPLVMNAVNTLNAACSTTGAISRDTTGGLLSCQGSLWKSPSAASSWRDPVNSFSSLPVTSNSVGDVRMTIDTARAFMWTGGGWSALAVDQSGNLTVPGTLIAAGGKVVAFNAVGEGGVLQLEGQNGTKVFLENTNGMFRILNNPWTAQIFSVDQNGNVNLSGVLYPEGGVVTNGNIYAGGAVNGNYFLPNLQVAAGSGCGLTNGSIAKSSSGLILSCQSGVWKLASTGTGLKAVLKPNAGQSASCSVGSATATVSVSEDGTPWLSLTGYGASYSGPNLSAQSNSSAASWDLCGGSGATAMVTATGVRIEVYSANSSWSDNNGTVCGTPSYDRCEGFFPI